MAQQTKKRLVYDVKAELNTNTYKVVIEVDCDNVSDSKEDEYLLNRNKMIHEGENEVCGEKVDVVKCSGDSEVPDYICYIAKKYSNNLKCVKMIVYRYRYVVKRLHDKGLKINLPLETGRIKLKEIKLAELDLVRIAQQSYFGKSNVSLIQKSGFMNALKCCSKNCRSKLIEIKNLLPFYDEDECVLHVDGRVGLTANLS